MPDYILLVDDDQAVLNQLSAQLTRRFGETHLVECAQSAEEALAIVEEIFVGGDCLQLVICDQVMPGLKGDRFLESVHLAHPEVMKILLTGEAGLESAVYAINHAGLHRYIEKPWEAEDLGLTVGSLLTQYRLARERAAYHDRVERRSRQLQKLNEAGLRLADAQDRERIAGIVREAACSLLGAPAAAVVAQVLPGDTPFWEGLPLDGIDEGLKRRIEGELVRGRAAGRTPEMDWRNGLGAAAGTPIEHTDTLYGWLFVPDPTERTNDDDELLAILTSQAAARLHHCRLEAERLESDRLTTIGRMMSSIIHDFRNPMTLIKGYGSMLEDASLTRERRAEYAGMVVAESDRMSAMIDEILEFTRGGRTALRSTAVRIDSLVEQIRRLIEPDLRARGVAFEVRLDYAGDVRIDVDRMKRALLNIASNAVEAMDEGGTFRVECRRQEGLVELALSDTGRGIPEEIRSRIFDPFFTHGKSKGIGLGMAITRKIVEEHGGEIRVESTSGRGTCITVRLPMSVAGAAGPDGPPRA